MTRATRVAVRAGRLPAGGLSPRSGAWLWWNYRPDRDQWIRTVHQVAAIALLVVAVALLVLAIVRRTRTGASGIVAGHRGVRHHRCGVRARAAAGVGQPRRCTQWSTDVAGVAGALDPSVFVIGIDGRQVSPSTYEVWAWSHLGLSVLVALALVMVWLRTRDASTSVAARCHQRRQRHRHRRPPPGRGPAD